MNRNKIVQYGSRNIKLLIVSGIIILLLLVQYMRQSWPFSNTTSRQKSDQEMQAYGGTSNDTNQNTRVSVQVDTAKLKSLGIQVEMVRIDTIAVPVRAVATVVPDEARVSNINTRVSGWLEKLYVNKTGQQVKAGAPLAGIFSQELYASQLEYLAVLNASRSGPESIVIESARTRLKVFGMNEAQIRELEKRGVATRLTTIVSPRTGTVFELNVFAGMAVDPSFVLMTIADLSQIWVFAEIPGSEEFDIRIGTPVIIDIAVSGRMPIESKVSFIYPALTEGTRTIRVRMVIENPGDQLRPGAYGTAEFKVSPREVLTVSRDAVVEQGNKQHVFVITAPGTFVPRNIALGVQLSDRVEVVKGLSKGELIVASGVFLIDSESRLRASGSVGGGHGHGGTQKAPEKSTPKKRPKSEAPPHGGHQGHGG